jgi:uncharacterized protein (TIGR03437 family)
MRAIVLFALSCPAWAGLPLWFEPNQGQAHPSVQFLSRDVYLGSNKAAIPLEGEKPIVVELFGAHKHAHAEGLDPQPGITSYFLGDDPKKWRAGVPHYARVRYKDVYPGIDVVYYHNAEGRLEYDFAVQPGADARAIQLSFNQPIHTDSDGDLLIAGVRQKRPKVFQGSREIPAAYWLMHGNRVQFALEDYDHSQALIVDPSLIYSTYIGGPAFDDGTDIKVGAQGNAYLTGTTRAPIAPSLNPFQQPAGASQDAFVIKLSPGGNGLVFYVFIGGDGTDIANSIALDGTGAATITGQTQSFNFPVKNAFQTQYGGGIYDAFVTKVSPDGLSLTYSSYLGGKGADEGYAVAEDAAGNAYVGGRTYGFGFPVKNAFQGSVRGNWDAFITKLSPDGKLLFSTFLGGSGSDLVHGLALDTSGYIYVTGFTNSDDFPIKGGWQQDRQARPGLGSFVAKLTPSADALVYSSFLSGGAFSVAVDRTGGAAVAGVVSDNNMQTKNAIQNSFAGGIADLFVLKMTPDGSDVAFATYLGGSDLEYQNHGLTLDTDGNVYVTGWTRSADFPTKAPLQALNNGLTTSRNDALITVLSSIGVLLYSTYLGGTSDDAGGGIAVDVKGDIYITGGTASTDFPIKNPFQQTFGGGSSDIFVAKISAVAAQAPPLNVSPAVLPFKFVVGGAFPSDQTFIVTSGTPGQAFSTITDAMWVNVTSNTDVTPATVNVSINPTGLVAGTYTGTIGIGGQAAVQVNLNVLNPAPNVASVAPSTVAQGSNDTTVVISGSGFVNGAVVQFAGTSASLPTIFVNANTLQLTITKTMAAAPGTYTLVVVNPQSAPSQLFQVVIGTPVPAFTSASVVNAASFAGGPVAPGEIISIFGTSLTGNVTFDGAPATPVFSSPTQVNVTVPYSVSVPTTVLQMDTSSVELPVAPSAPGIFAAASAGDGIVVLYTTGCGALTTDTLPLCALPISVTVNGDLAQVLYAGIAPGLVQGANQINFKLPADITTGQASIILTAGDGSSKPFNFTLP